MGMFLNYQNIADNYYPNNIVKEFPYCIHESKLQSCTESIPYEEYDLKGDLIGYSWQYGETMTLEFNLDGVITMKPDAIVYTSSGLKPSTSTAANIGQHAYNVVDFISWMCVAITNGQYVWEQDVEFIMPEEGSKKVYVSAETYLKDKYVNMSILNFRHERIHEITCKASPTIKLSIDAELSKKLVKGIYYCDVVIFNDNSRQNVFGSTDGSFLVK